MDAGSRVQGTSNSELRTSNYGYSKYYNYSKYSKYLKYLKYLFLSLRHEIDRS